MGAACQLGESPRAERCLPSMERDQRAEQAASTRSLLSPWVWRAEQISLTPRSFVIMDMLPSGGREGGRGGREELVVSVTVNATHTHESYNYSDSNQGVL